MLKINAGTTSITRFIEQYNNWCIAKSLATKHYELIFNDPSGFKSFDYRDVEGINECTDDIVAVDSVSEGAWHLMFPMFKQYKPRKHYLFFSVAEWDKSDFDLPYDYTLFSHTMKWWLYSRLLITTDKSYTSPLYFNYYDFKYPKKTLFNLTIGSKTPDRTYFVDQVKGNVPHKNVILKYSDEIISNPENLTDEFLQDKVRRNGYKNPTDLIGQGFDQNVDPKDSVNWLVSKIPAGIFKQTYFTLVSETNLDAGPGKNVFFITDKFVKPTMAGHPIVVMSTPGYLRRVRELGFETYSDFWDESYDDEPVFEKRIEKVIDLCNSLENFDWAKHKDGLEFIACKNIRNYVFGQVDTVMTSLENTIKENQHIWNN